MSTPAGEDGRPQSRRAVWITLGAIVVVGLIVVAIFVIGGGTGGIGHSGAAATRGTLTTTGAYATPATPGVTTGPHQTSGGQKPPSSAPQVGFNTPVAAQSGAQVTVAALTAITGKAAGPGEVGGPAVQFQVSVKNPTATSIPLGSAVVTLYYGADQNPGVQDTGNTSYKQLPASVAAGATVTGTYIFTVPSDARSDVRITFDYNAAAPQLVFQGSAPSA